MDVESIAGIALLPGTGMRIWLAPAPDIGWGKGMAVLDMVEMLSPLWLASAAATPSDAASLWPWRGERRDGGDMGVKKGDPSGT